MLCAISNITNVMVSYFNTIARVLVNKISEDEPFITHKAFIAALTSQVPHTAAERIAALPDLQRYLLGALTYMHLNKKEVDNFPVGNLVVEFDKMTGWLRDGVGVVV